MRTLDFAPLYRSSVGFDRLAPLFDQATRIEPSVTWPPYDIEKVDEDQYRITMAVAGFTPDEIDLTQHDGTLLVSGQKKGRDDQRQYLHRGIAARSFRQTFNLAAYVTVTGAVLENGLLVVNLERTVPDALKPRHIPIGGTATAIGQDNAATQVAATQVAATKVADADRARADKQVRVEDRAKAA